MLTSAHKLQLYCTYEDRTKNSVVKFTLLTHAALVAAAAWTKFIHK